MDTQNRALQKNVTIRPLNPDNDFHIRHVTNLVERSNAVDTGLSKATKSGNYWKLAASKKFTPLLALCSGKIIAHCGFGTSERSPTTGVLFHPMVDPEFADHTGQLASKFEAVIESQSRRRNLSSLLHFGTGERDSDGLLAQMGFVSVAELQNGAGTHHVSMRLIQTTVRSLEHVPPSLRTQVSRTYETLGIRSVTTASSDVLQLPLPADDAAIDIIPLARMGRALAFVNASLLVNKSVSNRLPHTLSDALHRWPRAIVCVNMADHGCTRMAELLRANQFEYQGVLPAVRNRDSLLFSRGFSSDAYRSVATAGARRKSSML